MLFKKPIEEIDWETYQDLITNREDWWFAINTAHLSMENLLQKRINSASGILK